MDTRGSREGVKGWGADPKQFEDRAVFSWSTTLDQLRSTTYDQLRSQSHQQWIHSLPSTTQNAKITRIASVRLISPLNCVLKTISKTPWHQLSTPSYNLYRPSNRRTSWPSCLLGRVESCRKENWELGVLKWRHILLTNSNNHSKKKKKKTIPRHNPTPLPKYRHAIEEDSNDPESRKSNNKMPRKSEEQPSYKQTNEGENQEEPTIQKKAVPQQRTIKPNFYTVDESKKRWIVGSTRWKDGDWTGRWCMRHDCINR